MPEAIGQYDKRRPYFKTKPTKRFLMSTPESNYNETLMRYLDGEMQADEKAGFENELASDKTLQQELAELTLTRDTVRYYGIRQQVAGIHTEMMQEMRAETPVRRINPIKRVMRYGMAAAASVIFVLFAWQAYVFYELSPEKLYAEQYQSFDISVSRDADAVVTEIEKLYGNKQFTDVTHRYEAGLVFEAKDKLLSGVSFLETGNAAKAITVLRQLIAENKAATKPAFNDEAEYYLALSYVRNKDYDAAIALINSIRANKDHLYHDRFSSAYVRHLEWMKWK